MTERVATASAVRLHGFAATKLSLYKNAEARTITWPDFVKPSVPRRKRRLQYISATATALQDGQHSRSPRSNDSNDATAGMEPPLHRFAGSS
jgi:hypothetical protein